MNFIKKESKGYNAGQWVLYSESGNRICQLGPTIEVKIRRIAATGGGDHINYIVEVTKSLIHHDEVISKNSLAALKVPNIGADARIAMSVFRKEDFGLRSYRIGLQPFDALGEQGHVMTIDGLLWDGRIIHVKDIAA